MPPLNIKEVMSKYFARNNPAAVQDGIFLLAQRGWFVTLWDMPIDAIPRAASWIKQGDTVGVDNAMTNYFEDAMPRLIIHIAKNFPKRCALIERAYMAHRLSLYDFSIPILLSQADGIGAEVFGISPYSSRVDSIAKIKSFVEATFNMDSLSGAYWQIVYSLLPIRATEKDVKKFEDPLNRHEVLHGIRCDYGTKENSCKAFSWLQYVASFKNDIGFMKKKTNNTADDHNP